MSTMEYFIRNILSVTVYGYMGSSMSTSYVLQYGGRVGEFNQHSFEAIYNQEFFSNALNN